MQIRRHKELIVISNSIASINDDNFPDAIPADVLTDLARCPIQADGIYVIGDDTEEKLES